MAVGPPQHQQDNDVLHSVWVTICSDLPEPAARMSTSRERPRRLVNRPARTTRRPPNAPRVAGHERERPNNRADRQMPLNRLLSSLHLVERTTISDRQVRHDIIELPLKRRIRREGCQDQLSQRPERLDRIGSEPEHLIAEPGTAHEVVRDAGTVRNRAASTTMTWSRISDAGMNGNRSHMRRNTEPRDRVELRPAGAPPVGSASPSKQYDSRPYLRMRRGRGHGAHPIITAAGRRPRGS